jgi:hypothetical protein
VNPSTDDINDLLREVVTAQLADELDPVRAAGRMMEEIDEESDASTYGYIYAVTLRMAAAAMHLLRDTNFGDTPQGWLELWRMMHPDDLGGPNPVSVTDKERLRALRVIASLAAGVIPAGRRDALVHRDPVIGLALLLSWLALFCQLLQTLGAGQPSTILLTLDDIRDHDLLDGGRLLSGLREAFLG